MKFTNIENDGTIRTYDDKEDSLIWDFIFRAVKKHDDKIDAKLANKGQTTLIDKQAPIKYRQPINWGIVAVMFAFPIFLLILALLMRN